MISRHGGLMVGALDFRTSARALAGDTVFCYWAGHFTLTVPLSTRSIVFTNLGKKARENNLFSAKDIAFGYIYTDE